MCCFFYLLCSYSDGINKYKIGKQYMCTIYVMNIHLFKQPEIKTSQTNILIQGDKLKTVAFLFSDMHCFSYQKKVCSSNLILIGIDVRFLGNAVLIEIYSHL